jgi:hypothetical protein
MPKGAMAQLTSHDIQEILQVLEDGIRFIPRIARSQKAAMRRKIRRQYAWLAGLIDPTARMVVHDLKEKLSDLFPLYSYGFAERLEELLKEKIGR